MKGTILALDISSVSTGWSVFKDGELHAKNKIATGKIKTHSEKLGFFERELCALYDKYSPDYFAAEDVFVGRSPKVHKILSLYHGIAYKIAFEKLGAEPITLYESEIRSIISEQYGVALRKSGEKAKNLTFDFINKYFKLNYEFNTHNDITDAIAVGLAVNIIGDDSERSLASFRGCARSKPKRNKKSVSKTGSPIPSRQKPKRSKSRRKVQRSK